MITLNSAEVKAEVKNKVIYTIIIKYLKENRNRFQNITVHFRFSKINVKRNSEFIISLITNVAEKFSQKLQDRNIVGSQTKHNWRGI